jgi:hypothetical protein
VNSRVAISSSALSLNRKEAQLENNGKNFNVNGGAWRTQTISRCLKWHWSSPGGWMRQYDNIVMFIAPVLPKHAQRCTVNLRRDSDDDSRPYTTHITKKYLMQMIVTGLRKPDMRPANDTSDTAVVYRTSIKCKVTFDISRIGIAFNKLASILQDRFQYTDA